MPGVLAFVGRTEQEAKDKFDHLQSLIHPQVGVRQLSNYIAYDLSRFPIDGPLPPIPKNEISNTRVDLLVEMANRDNLTIRQLYEKIAGGRGHFTLVGSATAGRRHARGMVHHRRRRRLQLHAADFAGLARRTSTSW